MLSVRGEEVFEGRGGLGSSWNILFLQQGGISGSPAPGQQILFTVRFLRLTSPYFGYSFFNFEPSDETGVPGAWHAGSCLSALPGS